MKMTAKRLHTVPAIVFLVLTASIGLAEQLELAKEDAFQEYVDLFERGNFRARSQAMAALSMVFNGGGHHGFTDEQKDIVISILAAEKTKMAPDDWFQELVTRFESKDSNARSEAMGALLDVLRNRRSDCFSDEQKDILIGILASEKWKGDMRDYAIELLGLLGKKTDKALAAVRRGLFARSFGTISTSIEAIGGLDDSSTETLNRLLWLSRIDSSAAGFRGEALFTLAKVFPENAKAMRVVVESLDSEDPGLQATAVRALGKATARCPGCYKVLREHLRDPDYSYEVIYAIVEFRDTMPAEAPRDIAALLRDSDSIWIHIHAAKALGFFGEDAAFVIPLLVSSLDRCSENADFYHYYWSENGNVFDPYWETGKYRLRTIKPIQFVVPWALSRMGPKGERAIRELEKGNSIMRRFAGVAGLYYLQDCGLPDLIKMLDDDSDFIRLAACDAILQIDSTRADVIPVLKELSQNQDPWIRFKVAILFQGVRGAPANMSDFFREWLKREPAPPKEDDRSDPVVRTRLVLRELLSSSRKSGTGGKSGTGVF